MAPNRRTLPFEKIEQIQLRVGREPWERLRWAVDFAQTMLNKLTPGQEEDIGWELAAFAYTLLWWDRLPRYHAKILKESFGKHTFPAKVTVNVAAAEEVEKTHKRFGSLLGDLRRTGHAEIGPLNIHFAAFWKPAKMKKTSTAKEVVNMYWPPFYSDPYKQRAEVVTAYPEGIADQAVVRLLELVQGHQRLLRICKDEVCSKWYVAGRLNQEYCSKTCQNRSRTRRHRAKRGAKKKPARKTKPRPRRKK